MRESAYSEIMQGFMDRLASINGVAAPKFDEKGLCVLGDDSAPVMLQIFEERKQLVFLSPIAVVPSDRREDIFEEMLSLNYFWSNTAGVTIAYDRESDEIVAQYAQSFRDLDVERFSMMLENFTAVCEMLRNGFAKLCKQLCDDEVDDEDLADEVTFNDDGKIFING